MTVLQTKHSDLPEFPFGALADTSAMESASSLPERVLRTISGVIGEQPFHPLHEPTFRGNEIKYLTECIDTGWVSSAGPFVDRFEAGLAEFTGMKKAVAVVNGTAALHLSLLLAGVKPGNEVLMPALTFVATANAVAYCGAVPHFIDSEISTLGVDATRLYGYLHDNASADRSGCRNRATGRRIAAVVAMHTFGHPVDLDPLKEVCDLFRITLVEDAAESLGSYYKGKHTGHWGKLTALSFNGNKVITTGGGGAILTDDEELGRLARHLSTTAKVPHPWAFIHDATGFNYRLPNLNAALGLAQLEQLPAFLASKRQLAEQYQQAFADMQGISFIGEPRFARSNYWLNSLLLDQDLASSRDPILELANKSGVMTRPAWTLMHKLPMYKDSPRMELPVAELLEQTLLNIPSSASLGGSHGQA